jgi:hypothetical protein
LVRSHHEYGGVNCVAAIGRANLGEDMHEPPMFIQFVPLLLLGIGFAFMNFNLAKSKGYSVALFTILAFIPLVNFFLTTYLVGAPDRILRAQIESLLRSLAAR